MFAKIDATENEIEGYSIAGFPTVKFFPGNKKNNAPVDYDGERSVEDLTSFIKKNVYHKLIVEEESDDQTDVENNDDKKDDKNEEDKQNKKDTKDETQTTSKKDTKDKSKKSEDL